MKISAQAVDRPLLMVLLGVALLVLGFIALSNLPLAQAPKINIPYVLAGVGYPSATAEDVERRITKKMEEAFREIDDVERISTFSTEGGAFAVLRFSENVSSSDKKRDVESALARARREFPDDAEEPWAREINFDNYPILLVNLFGDVDRVRLTQIAKTYKEAIEAVPGVADVAMFGERAREIRARLMPQRLEAYGLTFPEVAAALAGANIAFPGGRLSMGGTDHLLRVTGEFDDATEISETEIVTPRGERLRVGDIAAVVDTTEEIRNLARFNGKPCVTLAVHRRTDADTVTVIREIKKAVRDVKARSNWPVDAEFTGDQSWEIGIMVSQLSNTAFYGGIIVVTLLLLVLGIRTSILVIMAIPFSLLFAFSLMWFLDMKISNIALFSLILILGMVVDGAIIVAENIYRHMESGKGRIEAAKAGIMEVGLAVITADLTTISAFIPLMFVAGVSGQFMGVMPKIVIFTLIGSVIVDHFILPAVAGQTLRVRKRKKKSEEPRPADSGKPGENVFRPARGLLGILQRAYRRLIGFALRHPVGTVTAAFAALFAACFLLLLGFIPSTFFPKVDIGRFNVNFELPPGTPIGETSKVARRIEAELDTMDKEYGRGKVIRTYTMLIGDTGALNVNPMEGGSSPTPENGRITVELVDVRKRTVTQSVVIDRLKAGLPDLTGARLAFYERREGPPTGKTIMVHISSDDLDALGTAAEAVKRILEETPGARNPSSEFKLARPKIIVRVNRKLATAYGIAPAAVVRTVGAAYGERSVTEFDSRDEEIEVRIERVGKNYGSPEDIRKLSLRAATGEIIPLDAVADVILTSGIVQIKRRDFRRTTSVGCDVAEGFDEDDARAYIREKLEAEPALSGVTFEVGTGDDESERSMKSLKQLMPFSLLLIFFILAIQFNSLRQPLVIMLTIPLSLIGVFIGLFVTGNSFGFLALIGIVALAGIVVNDAIVLIDFVNVGRRKGLPIVDALVEAGTMRLRPIMLTTITTIGGLAPLALNIGGGGRFWSPLSWAIIFGIAVATALTLLVVPCSYLLIEGTRKCTKAKLK
ncbi:MAG: efflux RND transporter permease subunit [Planctomycetota bacterium]|nr:MAG: efflux RND transporter permease subunit [Planctomycetota bacterium]